MRHVREVLRLTTAGVPGNEIARQLNLAPSTVRLTLRRLATAGLRQRHRGGNDKSCAYPYDAFTNQRQQQQI